MGGEAKDRLQQRLDRMPPLRALTNGNAGNSRGAARKPWARALDIEVLANPNLLRRLARKTFAMALKGNLEAMKEIANRLDGKAVQATELTVNGGAEMFRSMTRDQIMQAIRERIATDATVAQALGLQLPALVGPIDNDGAAPEVPRVVASDPVR